MIGVVKNPSLSNCFLTFCHFSWDYNKYCYKKLWPITFIFELNILRTYKKSVRFRSNFNVRWGVHSREIVLRTTEKAYLSLAIGLTLLWPTAREVHSKW